MKYDDIINREYHGTRSRKKMSMEMRSAQFMPFKALTGHEDLLNETDRETLEDINLIDEDKYLISDRINYLLNHKGYKAIFRVFIKDKYKDGGSYAEYEGSIVKYDGYARRIRLDNHITIIIDDIRDIQIKDATVV
ncbi:MAG: hypothetical protein ACI4P1_06330 [Erysipelotrichaceae bacterium]